MQKAEIIQALASRRDVEDIVCAVCRRSDDDLSQMIYEALMRLPEHRLVSLYESNRLLHYISGIAYRQYYSAKSTYHTDFRRKPRLEKMEYALSD